MSAYQFYIIHGALEGSNSNLAGYEDLTKELFARYPNSTLERWSHSNFSEAKVDKTKGKAAFLCNSWGAQAVYDWLKKNRNTLIDVVICLDPVMNPINPGGEWEPQPNAGWILALREQDSLLRGNAQAAGNLQMFTGMRDYVNRFVQYEYGRRTEVVLDREAGILGNFGAHFEILTKHPYVKLMMLERLDKAQVLV